MSKKIKILTIYRYLEAIMRFLMLVASVILAKA